jgi:beta-lactam-binding protein with PASTA domain
MKSFFRVLLLSLILVTVALISALTSMRLAIHGREVAIPPLLGLTPDEAARRVDDLGLRVEVEQKFYSASVPAGKIVSQVPEPGTQVRRGWRVLVAESLGPQRVSPPDVVGQTERAAEINIRRRGLQVGEIAMVSLPGQESGKVVAQNPPANATSVASPNISLLTTSSGAASSYVMPNLAGLTLASATQALKDGGAHVGTVTVVIAAGDANAAAAAAPAPPSLPPPGPASIIVSQSPAPGQRIQEGSAVNFEVRP